MKTRLLSMMFMLLCTASVVQAATEVTVDSIKYKIEGGTASVVGYVEGLRNADIQASVSDGRQNYPVTSIGNDAFEDCSSLTSVTIPGSVTSIGEYAFYGCSGLTSVIISEGVTSIGNMAFYGCTNLESIEVSAESKFYTSSDGVLFNKAQTILLTYPAGKQNSSYVVPNMVTSIGKSAFSNCSSLTSVTIPDSVTSIGKDAFSCCSGLTSVTISSSVTSIGESAFSSCSSLTSVIISEGVTSIGDYAFRYCSSLVSMSIPGSVTSIGTCALESCTSLKSIEISSDNKFYSSSNGVLFDKTQKTLIAYPIGKQDSSYAVPNTVTTIERSAFDGCSSLTSVTILGSVKSIGMNAFYHCDSLTSMTLPYSITSIGYGAFSGCKSLKEIYCLAEMPPAISSSTFYNLYRATLYVPKDCMSAYKADEYWKKFTNMIGYVADVVRVEGIGYRIDSNIAVVASCGSDVTTANVLTSVEHDSKTCPVVRIGTSAFENCNDLTSITIPVGIYEIEEYAFKGCTHLISVTVPSGVLKIGKYAFQDCYRLPSLELPSGTTEICEGAFSNCSSLLSITISDSVTEIGERAFEDCSTLTDIICCAMIPPFIAENTFDSYTATLHVPIGSKAAYKKAAYWRNFTNSVEEELAIGSMALQPLITYAAGILSLPDNNVPVTVYVYTQDGKCVRTCPMAVGERTCDLSSLAPGIYLVRVKAGNEISCLKIVR